jgi:hypothetical protein
MPHGNSNQDWNAATSTDSAVFVHSNCFWLAGRGCSPVATASSRPLREVHALFLFDGSLVADVTVRVLFDLGETFLCELFVNCPLNGLVDQLLRDYADRDVDLLVGFVGRKVGASVIIVVNLLPVGAGDHEQKRW